MKSKGSFVIPKTFKGINRSIYLPKDTNIQVNNDIIAANSMVELFSDQIATLKNNKGDARILMLQGRPINEQVESYGPFVMNTRSEIQEAFYDYNKTEFGGWKWGNSDPVHGMEKEKFAKLINGNIIKPS